MHARHSSDAVTKEALLRAPKQLGHFAKKFDTGISKNRWKPENMG